MRKFLIFLVLFLSAASLFAQNVEEISGFEWKVWSYNQKVGYVQGFYSAYSSAWERFFLEMDADGGITEEESLELEKYFYIPLTVEEAINRIDAFYSDYDNRDTWLYRVLMYIAGKDYWNSSSFQERLEQQEPDPSKRS